MTDYEDTTIVRFRGRTSSELQGIYRTCGLDASTKSLDRSEFEFSKTVYRFKDILVCQTKSSVGWDFERANDADLYFITLVSNSELTWTGGPTSPEGSAGHIIIMDNLQVISGTILPGANIQTIVIPGQLLHARQSALQGFPCTKRLIFKNTLPFDSPQGQAILASASLITSSFDYSGVSIFSSALAMAAISDTLIFSVLQSFQSNFSDLTISQKTACPGQIKRAIDFMLQNISHPISIADIAIHANTSVRNLQIVFKDQKGMSPMNYLRMLRLKQARIDILDPQINLTAAEIGRKWGFSSYQLFARYYKCAYGINPGRNLMLS